MDHPDIAVVPCNGCKVCCRNEMIFLFPERGDIVESFDAVAAVNPFDGEPRLMLRHRPNGDCVYLGKDGCTIHHRAPSICKAFDCRAYLLDFGDRTEQRRALREGRIDRDTYDAARASIARSANADR